MFDDYVEHSSGPAAPVTATSGVPPLDFEGFEPSPYDLNDPRPEFQETHPAEKVELPPIFDIGRVQYPFPALLVSCVVASDILIMGFENNLLSIIELSHADQVIQVRIPRKREEMTIHKLFVDPSGRHIIITSKQGENWYFYRTWKEPRRLKGFKMVIESIAWNKRELLSSPHSTSTREMLIGTGNGSIYEAVLDAGEVFFKSQERYLQSVFSLPERHPITGIKFEFFPAADPRKALVIVTTASRIYQFVGKIPDGKSDESGRVFWGLFNAYQQTTPSEFGQQNRRVYILNFTAEILELPGKLRQSELRFFTPNAAQSTSLPKAIAWMTGPGIYHGTLNFESQTEDYIDAAELLPYPSLAEEPESPYTIALTEFHYILIYKNRLAAVCSLDDQVKYEDPLPLVRSNRTRMWLFLDFFRKVTGEEVLGVASDPIRNTYWIYTRESLFELVVGNEDRDVWKIYLEKQQFETALKFTKASRHTTFTAAQRDDILRAQADAFFVDSRFFQAAQCYAQCSSSFEEVALKFLDAGERDALRSYLISRLERTRKGDLAQRMILATWLVEFYLSKCNELDDIIASESISDNVDNLQTEKTILEDDFRQFLDTYKLNLDRNTTYELIQGHGRTDMYLHYANTIGDYERVIEHWIVEEDWLKAIETDLELYYRFGPVLMRRAPKETVDSWLRQSSLDPLRLIPSILQLQYVPRDPLSPNQAIRYLNHLIFEQHNISPTVHNLLITFHVLPPPAKSSAGVDDGPLLRFLQTAPCDPVTGKPYYDLDYALRLCKNSGRTQPCVHIYSKMGLWENSVDMAIEKGDVELAMINADMPEEDPQLQKKLWLKIARYVVQDKKDIKTAMRFLENTALLKIEDILPFFPDFIVIDDFKEEIAHALEGYASHIESLRNEMNEATQTAESIKQDIAALRNRFVTIDAGEQCSVKEYLPPSALRKIISLQNQLTIPSSNVQLALPPALNPAQQVRGLLSANFGAIPNPLQNGASLLGKGVLTAGDRLRDLIMPDAIASLITAPAWMPEINEQAHISGPDFNEKTEKLRAQLEDILAGSCPLCESVIAGLDTPFVKDGEVDTTWAL
ncbi:hypothetical protein H0H93_015233 [Arthromyces matolae]|nr:hypothetical protein H0H93_015233 [Arthromyces matolae]